MELGQSQQTRLAQTTVLSQHQMQSLNLLMTPVMELEQKIEEAMSANPMLELDPDLGISPDDVQTSPKTEDDVSRSDPLDDDPGPTAPSHDIDPELPEIRRETNFDENRDDFSEAIERMLSEGGDNNWGDESGDLETRQDHRQFLFDSIVLEQSLQEFLSEQLKFSDCPDEPVREAAEEVIAAINEAGYLVSTTADIAQVVNCPLDIAERALTLVQSFDPPGIAARTPKECLLLQLRRQGRQDSPLAQLVRDHLDEVAKNKLPHIAQAMHLSMEDLQNLLAELKKLHPHPASALGRTETHFVVPEVFVEKDEHGEYAIRPNRDFTPKLYLSKYYLNLLSSPETPQEVRDYLKKNLTGGKQLIRAMEQRERTIVRIAREIVNAQHSFLEEGPESLRPMKLRDVADKLGLEESTISRAIAEKYLQTPRGLWKFRDFFSGGYQSAEDGTAVSARSIKEILRDMIAEEDPKNPLSDSKLSEELQKRGYQVARRTVAKYREELSIQPSNIRKQF